MERAGGGAARASKPESLAPDRSGLAQPTVGVTVVKSESRCAWFELARGCTAGIMFSRNERVDWVSEDEAREVAVPSRFAQVFIAWLGLASSPSTAGSGGSGGSAGVWAPSKVEVK